MPISMHQLAVPVVVKSLENLKAILGKGKAHAQERKVEESVFLNSRLYPDMLPLTKQVHIATDIARGTGARLAGAEPPGDDADEQSFDELVARVDRSLAYLRGLDAKAFDGAETREITRPVRGTPHTFTGTGYLLQFALPNIYFHVTTAYDILRHGGVPLGKADFLGPLD